MLHYHRSSEIYAQTLKVLNFIFLGIFCIEAALKMIAYAKAYFYDGWNQFDFGIIVCTLIGIALEETGVIGQLGTAISIIRTFRIARILRLVKRAQSLRTLFSTFV